MELQGLEVFWKLIKPQIQNRHEAALALTHWLLVGSGYRCVGHGTELSLDPLKTPSELLPSNWHERSAGYYSLLYTTANTPSASELILLKFIPAASITDSVILGQIVVSGGDDDVIPFEVNSFHIIPEQWQTYASPTSFPHFKTFVDTIDRDVVEKLRSKKRGEGAGVGAARPPPPAGSAEQPTRYIVPPVPVPAVPNPFAPLAPPPPPLAEFIPPRPAPDHMRPSSSAATAGHKKTSPKKPKEAKDFLFLVCHLEIKKKELVSDSLWRIIQEQKTDQTMDGDDILELVLGGGRLETGLSSAIFMPSPSYPGVERVGFKILYSEREILERMVAQAALPQGVRYLGGIKLDEQLNVSD